MRLARQSPRAISGEGLSPPRRAEPTPVRHELAWTQATDSARHSTTLSLDCAGT